MRPVTPAAWTAAIVSPPPITEKPPLSATARPTPMVPAANGVFSKTPMGPFQMMVPAPLRAAANWATVPCPISRPIMSRGISRTDTVRTPAVASGLGATTTSTGNRTAMPRARARSSTRRAASMRSCSRSERPTSWPRAARKVNAMPPPTSSPSTFSRRCSTRASLSDTLAPPSTARSGGRGRSKIRDSASSSLLMSRPATAGLRKWVMASIEACARCAAAKASLT